MMSTCWRWILVTWTTTTMVSWMSWTTAFWMQTWISVTSMRTISLLGNLDPGASKALSLQLLLAFAFVAILNVPLLVAPRTVTSALSATHRVRCS